MTGCYFEPCPRHSSLSSTLENWRENSGSQSAVKKNEKEEEEVTISVGLLEWKETDMKLKPVRGNQSILISINFNLNSHKH